MPIFLTPKNKTMAKQDSIIEIKGTIGKLTFYKSKKGGYIVKRKTSLSGERIKSDPKFVRTRENLAEFAQATRAGKQIRLALAPLISNLKDGDMTTRLSRTCFRILQTDTINGRGQRKVEKGDFNLLKNFEFNITSPLSATIAAHYTPTINRATGAMSILVPPFVPDKLVKLPIGATHFQLTAAALSLDLVTGSYEVSDQRSAILPWNELETSAINLNLTVAAASSNPLFLGYGIEFYQEMNGIKYLLKNGAFTALSFVKVDIAPPAPPEL
jgi:hypothetical protein